MKCFQVDGNLTQNENLADIAGLQVARRAYMMERQFTPGSERKLPGLDFNLDQLYFLGVAQVRQGNLFFGRMNLFNTNCLTLTGILCEYFTHGLHISS
jgi:hypothetical protein